MNQISFSFLFLPCILFLSCYPPRSAEQILARKLQKHQIQEDTSHMYQLPYREGTSHRMIQGYYSRYTHKYRAAVDFRMKKGTPIVAARDGLVIRTKSDSNKGGFNKKYRPDANFIIIQHSDSTRASYRHLQFEGVLVKPGDIVKTGQLIGYSGNTGYTLSPHLHFMITKYQNGQWNSIPCRFATNKRNGYVQTWRRYKSLNKMNHQ